MTSSTAPSLQSDPPHILNRRDLFFASINGIFIGIFAPFVLNNLSQTLPVSRIIFTLGIAILCIIGISVGYFLTKISTHRGFFQLAKFGLIGTTNFIIDAGILSFLVWETGITKGIPFVLFNIISVAIAIINSYIWNKFWSFEEKSLDEERLRKQFFQFVTVSIVGLIMNTTITSILNAMGSLTAIDATKWTVIAKAIAAIVVLVWNFVGYKFFVFKR